MKVLLVGNYLPDGQQSMQNYAAMMEAGLRARGHDVRLLRPPVRLGGRAAEGSSSAKWQGYADKFLLFRRDLQRAARKVDIVHVCDHSNAMYVPILESRPNVVTCHDALAMRSAMGHFLENRVGRTGRIFQRLIARGLHGAQCIACVSEKTRGDLVRYVGVAAERLHVVPNALQWPYCPLGRDACLPQLRTLGIGAESRYFLHVGGNHWYKNRRGVIAIFAQLRRMPEYAYARLVMAGSPLNDELRVLAVRHGVSDTVVEAPGVSNETLQALYSGALALLFPSLEEGFGWPILEAQACGCPVATTDREPMSEVAGGAAILLDPAMPEDAARRIADRLQNTAQMRVDGLRNAEAHSADAMLDQYESLYQKVVEPAMRRDS